MDFLNKLNLKKSYRSFVHDLMTKSEVGDALTTDMYLRASGIYDVCFRFNYIAVKYKIKTKEDINEKLFKIFAFGRMYERFFRDEVLASSQTLIGKWECRVCGFISESPNSPRHARPQQCEVCGANAFAYKEEDLISHEFRVSGHPDGFVFWDSKYWILELKTTNSFNFSKIQMSPFEKHIAQVQVYMHLTGYQQAMIWYFNKDTAEDIMHEVVYDKDRAVFYLSKGQQLKYYFDNNIMPEKVCLNNTCSRAVRCQVSKLCFTDGV